MKIIYAKPVLEQVREAIAEATKNNRVIEKIILTRSEMDLVTVPRYSARAWATCWPAYLLGIPVEVE